MVEGADCLANVETAERDHRKGAGQRADEELGELGGRGVVEEDAQVADVGTDAPVVEPLLLEETVEEEPVVEEEVAEEPPPVEQPVEPPPEEQPEQLPEEPAEEAEPPADDEPVELVYWSMWNENEAQAQVIQATLAEAGIRVRVLLDSFGAKQVEGRLIEMLKQAGAEVRWFRPLSTWRIWRSVIRHRPI